MTTLLITGADGFVGRHLCALALRRGLAVRGAVRALPAHVTGPALAGVAWVACGDLERGADWSAALAGVDAVVHVAGRAHVLRREGPGVLDAYRATNVVATQQLAQAMASCHVRRLVFVSTILVHGDATGATPFTETSPARPRSAYAQSKWEAEEWLRTQAPPGLEPVIVRPVLVYGPGVKGNLRRLLRWLARGWPLPLAGIRNARSLVDIDHLCDLLLACATRPDAAGRVLLAADPAPLTTPELVRELAASLGRPARLFAVPAPLLRTALWVLQRHHTWEQLTGSLVADATRSRAWLGDGHADDPRAGLVRMARAFIKGAEDP